MIFLDIVFSAEEVFAMDGFPVAKLRIICEYSKF